MTDQDKDLAIRLLEDILKENDYAPRNDVLMSHSPSFKKNINEANQHWRKIITDVLEVLKNE
ncbi:MAG: hypothetical protein PVI43_01590 [Candidatus Bathyarchaeota archaeon]|jgi:hypothetical protein